jgi:exosortase/archaeosortase family protein
MLREPGGRAQRQLVAELACRAVAGWEPCWCWRLCWLALACHSISRMDEDGKRHQPGLALRDAGGNCRRFLRSPAQWLWIQSSAANVYLLQVVPFRSVQGCAWVAAAGHGGGRGAVCTIGTPRFSVSVGAPCSGIEGLGLVLVFTIVWLWFFRRENRFPHALLLIPCALVCAFLLNVVRIATLILIGNAGAPEVAFVGFHSQAGWIAFTLVALGFQWQRRSWHG